MANNGIFYSSGNSLNFTTSGTTWLSLNSQGLLSGLNLSMSAVTANTISQVNYIDFDTTPNVPAPTGGTLYFDSTENALSYKPITPSNDVTVNLGQETLVRIYNDLGFQINNGQALHITGATSGAPTVSLAVGTGGDSVQFQISGIATHDIPDSSFGFMTNFGIVRDLNLTAFTVGEQIYLSQTVPGGFSSYSGLSFTGRTCEVGHIIDNSASGKIQVTILNEIEGTIITTQENNILAANNSSTGVFEFSGLSITTPSGTTFNVGPVQGWIIDNVTEPANPTIQLIIYSGSTGNTALYVSSATETYILLTSGLTITQQTTFPTPQQRRQNLYLGKFGHANRQFLINAFNEPDSSLSSVSQLRDMFTPIRLINGGIYPSANGNSLTFNSSAGVLYGLGIGYITNKLDPNSLSVSGTSPCTFQYRTQTGGTASNTTLIDPTVYDNNGVVTAVGGGSNSSTNQRIYLVQNGQFRLQYGQQVYGSLAAAIEASQNEAFTTFSNFRDNAALIGILSVNKNATNLSDTTQARFLPTSKFGETVGTAGGISTTNLQQAYNNSATPEIVTNSAEGALSIKNGTGGADNVTNLLEGQNSGGTTTSFIRADGAFSGTSIYGTGLSATTISASTYYNLPGSSSANCFTDFFVTNISGCSPVNMLSPLNVQDGLSVTGTSTFTSQVNFTGGLSANTFSAETYQNLPSFNSVQINGTTQFSGNTNNFINFSGINITITSAATNTLVFSAGTGGGGISGSGTSNYLPKFTSSTAIGNSQLQDDGTQIFVNEGYVSTYAGKLSINTSGTTGVVGRSTQYGVVGTLSGNSVDAAGVYGESVAGQYGVFGRSVGDTAGTYIGIYGEGIEADTGAGGTTYIGGKFYGDPGSGAGYSVWLQDGSEGLNKVLVSATSDGKANWGTVAPSVISGSTTVGQNLITLANPSEIRYIRINANNSITTLTATQLQSDLGLIPIVLTGDVAITATNTNLNDVTGLSFAIVSGNKYKFRAELYVTTSVSNTGSKFAVNANVAVSAIVYRATGAGGTAAANFVHNAFALDSASATNVGAVLSSQYVVIEGILIANNTGTAIIRFGKGSANAGTLTVKAGSFLNYQIL